jgi:hypothetical protein
MRAAPSLMLLLLASCAQQGADAVETSSLPLRSCNGLSALALAGSRAELACLAQGAFTTDRLAGCGFTTADSLQVAAYTATCALPASQSVEDPEGTWLAGKVGLAPSWANQACGATCQRAVSGCLLAHTNLLGAPVDISITAAGLPPRSPAERESYPTREGAFFGNVFAGGNQAYACTTTSVLADLLSLRLCSTSLCYVTVLGICGPGLLGACASQTGGADSSFQKCRPLLLGSTYDPVITTWVP